ncbi:MAG: NAD(P)-binding domain-containing protein, partial [Alphaproteobacteria bacterium]|nr:NAD(P)-binding domain-containing protein [Alphaproteobacteria bacterium]
MTESVAKPSVYDHIGVIGAGAWGTALALAAAQAGRKTTLWARESDVVASITRSRENVRYLAGTHLPDTIHATGDLNDAAKADAILLVVPAQHLRATLSTLTPLIADGTPLL